MAGEQEKQSREESPQLGHQHHQDVSGGNHESVEEAVFRYVGVGLQHEEDSKGKKQYEGKGDGHDGVSKAHSDMEWLFRHAQGVEDDAAQDSSARERQSVALAAVAAAYGSGGGGLGKRGLEKTDEEDGKGDRAALKRARKAKEDKAKLQLAVDPELATLDDSGVSEHDQLVRKAIIDTDSIAQHPDFQQYLNTDVDGHKLKVSQKLRDKSDDSDDDDKGLEDVDPSVVAASAANHDDDLGDVTKQYSELHKDSAIDGPVTKSLQKKDYREVLPKVMSSSEISVDTDVSHLIQSAASKASAIIGTTTQSSGKSFDSAEEAALEQFITEYQTIKNLDRQQICERIWSNERRKDDFWSNMCKVLPYRSRSSIYKHVRRKYHIFEQRGKWTPQEDQELARLCVEKEGQWSEVGKALGRMPEDCRDRWRNYVKCGSSRASNKWAPDEEELLKRVIAEMLEESERNYLARNSSELVQDDSEGENDSGDDRKHDVLHGGKDRKLHNKPSFKDAINWTVVSERMGGTRSRIQCRYKWNKLVKKEAIAKIQSIAEGDKRWILEKLRDLGFTEDSQVDWEELAALKPGMKWTGTELKLCYERMRSGIRYYKQKSINEISRELLGLLDGSIPLDSKGN